MRSLRFSRQRVRLLCGRFNGTRQLGPTRIQAAHGKSRFVGLTLQTALLFATFIQFALCPHHAFVKLGMPFLGIGELHVELFKTTLCRHPALLQVAQKGIHLGQVVGNLRTAHTGLLGQLAQSQGFHLQFMSPVLALCRFAPHHHQTL